MPDKSIRSSNNRADSAQNRKAMQVWGIHYYGGKKRVLIAAKSRADAARLAASADLRISGNEQKTYGSITGNQIELAVAQERGIWMADNGLARSTSDYVRII